MNNCAGNAERPLDTASGVDGIPSTMADWHRALRPYCIPSLSKSASQLLISLSAFCSLMLLAHVGHAQHWALGVPLSVMGGFLLVKLFIIQHDCGHRSYFRSPRACDVVGHVLSVLTVTPYEFWRRDHDKHHATSGNLDRRGFGDINTLTVKEYQGLSFMARLRYRIYRHPLTLFGIGPSWQFLVMHRLPSLQSGKNRWRIIQGVLLHDLALAIFFGGLSLLLGWTSVAAVWLPAIITGATIGVWLVYVQHAFDTTYWEKSGNWSFLEASLQGCSYYRLPRALHWVTGNIGYHHIHHLCSRIPNYRLPQVFSDMPTLRQVRELGIVESLGCVRLALWSEDSQRLVSFREALRIPA